MPGSSPGARRIGSGLAPGGGIASASAAADALTSPPAASTSSARARSPTRCGGGSSPEPQLTPRLGRSATWSSPRNQPAASATSRASASSGVRMTSGLAELLVEGGDQERQRRLGDASPCVGKLFEERAEALAFGELAHQRVKDGSVHDD